MSTKTKIAGDLFLKLYDRYTRFENKKFLCQEIEELTIIEIKTIIVIGRFSGVIKMSEIAHQLGVTSGTPTVTVDRLIKKGYVERIRDEEDRRQVFVKLTALGATSYDAIVTTKDLIMEKIFGIVSSEQIDLFISILDKIETDFDEVFSDLMEVVNERHNEKV